MSFIFVFQIMKLYFFLLTIIEFLCNFSKVKLPYDLACPSVYLLVGRSVIFS